jgi:CDP-paratose 2-epimerase
MKVFVSGGCGFLGSHVCEHYIKRGDEVVSYDSMTKYELERTGYAAEGARRYNWDVLESMGVQMVKADIRDKEAVMDHVSGCDYIVHTAAQPAMTISWEDPALDFSTNVIGTFNLLEAARHHRIPIASCATIHVYGNLINDTLQEAETRYVRNPAAIDESHPTMEGNLSPLHASKMTGDLYCRTYAKVYRMKVASFRLTGIYGPRQFGGEDHGWVANFSIRAAMGWPLTIFGTGKQVRDILFAEDVTSAFHAFYKKQESGIYNIGGGEDYAISLLECIDMIKEIVQKDVTVNFDADRYGDLRYFICDIAKATSKLDWKPTIPPRQGVEALITWIKNNEELFTLT